MPFFTIGMENKMDLLVSLTKRRGFIFPGSEIYGGLSGSFDYGPLGLALKNNIKNLWWKMFVSEQDAIYGVDAAIIMNPKVWEASGHVAGFSDPLSICEKCGHRFRTDQITDPNVCPDCGGKLSSPKKFNMMFKTSVGATDDESSVSYLRPETAQGIFVNFKNIIDCFHPKLPFGIAQIGKAFRNEIAPRDFLFRQREFEQMELEYFIKESEWETHFEKWRSAMKDFADAVGIEGVSENDKEDLAHYSKKTIDFEFDYPFGRGELWGLAYRTDFDLRAHSTSSGTDLTYLDEETSERFTPHVIEPSLGVDRTVLAVLLSAYTEDELGGEKRIYLKLSQNIAPVRAAVFPLLKNKPELVKKAREVYENLKAVYPNVAWDDNGNIGKRYRRQDEIGTPSCITIDFDTLENDTVTVRDRDTGEQRRVAIADLVSSV
ncbi:MAG: glycine--tRNA ligase [Minisyncoccia bacterium]